MIECPWCTKEVIIVENICPECKHEVLLDHTGDIIFEEIEENQQHDYSEGSIEDVIIDRFKCAKCGHMDCEIKELAMTSTGLSKIFDIQYNHYLFVSCLDCGYVEIFNPDILGNKKRGSLGTVMDIFFGR